MSDPKTSEPLPERNQQSDKIKDKDRKRTFVMNTQSQFLGFIGQEGRISNLWEMVSWKFAVEK